MVSVWQSFERQVMICQEAEVKKFVGLAVSTIALVGFTSCGGDDGGNPNGSEIITQGMMEIGGEQGFQGAGGTHAPQAIDCAGGMAKFVETTLN